MWWRWLMKSLSLCQFIFFLWFLSLHIILIIKLVISVVQNLINDGELTALYTTNKLYINYKTLGWGRVKLYLFICWLNTQPCMLIYLKLNVCKLCRLFFVLFFQTSFVDCLMEQTHPEIEGAYDVDVSASVTCISKAEHNAVGCRSLSVETWLIGVGDPKTLFLKIPPDLAPAHVVNTESHLWYIIVYFQLRLHIESKNW